MLHTAEMVDSRSAQRLKARAASLAAPGLGDREPGWSKCGPVSWSMVTRTGLLQTSKRGDRVKETGSSWYDRRPKPHQCSILHSYPERQNDMTQFRD